MQTKSCEPKKDRIVLLMACCSYCWTQPSAAWTPSLQGGVAAAAATISPTGDYISEVCYEAIY